MLSSSGVGIIRRLSENTFGRWSHNGFSIGPFNLKRVGNRWGRRTISDLLPCCLTRSSIIFWPSSDGNGCRTIHYEHFRTKWSRRLRLLDHLGLLRQKRFFKDSKSTLSSLEKSTQFGPSRIVLGVVLFITNQIGILQLTLRTIISTRFGRIWFRGIGLGFPLPFFFPL